MSRGRLFRLWYPEDAGGHSFIERGRRGKICEALREVREVWSLVLKPCGYVSQEDVAPPPRLFSLLSKKR